MYDKGSRYLVFNELYTVNKKILKNLKDLKAKNGPIVVFSRSLRVKLLDGLTNTGA
jgi:hypothetical protein